MWTLSRSGLFSSVELVHEGVAGVGGHGFGSHPVLTDDGHVEWVEGNVDTAEAHAPEVYDPAEEPHWAKSLYFL